MKNENDAKETPKEKDAFTLHIENVLETCKRLGVTTHELLKMDYPNELNITNEQRNRNTDTN